MREAGAGKPGILGKRRYYMKSKKLLSLILSLLVVLFALPGMTFAEDEKIAVGGILKIQGEYTVGAPLSADYKEVLPQGLTDQDFTFRWERWGEEEEEFLLLGTEKTYIPAETDEGAMLVLSITVKDGLPFEGTLEAVAERPIQPKPAAAADAPEQNTVLFDGLLSEEELQAAGEAEADVVPGDPEEFTEDIIPAVAEETAGLFGLEEGNYADSSFTEPEEASAEGAYIEGASIEEIPAEGTEDGEEENTPVAVTMQDLPAEDSSEAAGEEDAEEVFKEDAEETSIEKAAGTEDAAVGADDDLFDEDLSEVEDDWVGDDGEEEDYAGSFSTSTDVISFPDAEEGYSIGSITAQQFTVTNTGAETLHMFMDATSVQEYFDVEFPAGVDVDDVTIEPGQSMTFSVLPMEGLTSDTYEDYIYVDAQEVADYMTIMVTFTVTGGSGSSGSATLQRVTAPAAVANLANGLSPEEVIASLPSTAHIYTSAGEMDVPVDWDDYDLDYDPDSTESQTFEVIGLLDLPSGVSNPDDIDEYVTVSVTVKAAGEGGTTTNYTANPDNNMIYGVDPTGAYTTETRITFTAVGDGMDNTSPNVGDTRFIPVSWMVLESRNFDGEPFEASFRIAKAGGFTLTVTFNEQTYTSDGWVNTGVQDTKAVDFNVTDAANPITITPGAVNNNAVVLTPAATTRNAVATGDDTPIGAFVTILVVAVACIGGIIVYKKKRK